MAFFKKMLKKINNRWYPQSVLVGKPITTERIAYRLAAASTLTPSDVIAVLVGLGPVMADYMAQGHSVKLAGIGTFFLTATTAKGVALIRIRDIADKRVQRRQDPTIELARNERDRRVRLPAV